MCESNIFIKSAQVSLNDDIGAKACIKIPYLGYQISLSLADEKSTTPSDLRVFHPNGEDVTEQIFKDSSSWLITATSENMIRAFHHIREHIKNHPNTPITC